MPNNVIIFHSGDDARLARKSDMADIAKLFVLDLIKVDKNGTEHWLVVRESVSDSKQDQMS
jgi:hypothetical protein